MRGGGAGQVPPGPADLHEPPRLRKHRDRCAPAPDPFHSLTPLEQLPLRSFSDVFDPLFTPGGVADDLWRAWSEASGVDVAGLMHTWTKRMGYPYLKVVTH